MATSSKTKKKSGSRRPKQSEPKEPIPKIDTLSRDPRWECLNKLLRERCSIVEVAGVYDLEDEEKSTYKKIHIEHHTFSGMCDELMWIIRQWQEADKKEWEEENVKV